MIFYVSKMNFDNFYMSFFNLINLLFFKVRNNKNKYSLEIK